MIREDLAFLKPCLPKYHLTWRLSCVMLSRKPWVGRGRESDWTLYTGVFPSKELKDLQGSGL